MATVSKYTVVPRVPERLKALTEIAGNLWWCWNHDAIDLFHRIDRDLWTSVNQNPLRDAGQDRPTPPGRPGEGRQFSRAHGSGGGEGWTPI